MAATRSGRPTGHARFFAPKPRPTRLAAPNPTIPIVGTANARAKADPLVRKSNARSNGASAAMRLPTNSATSKGLSIWNGAVRGWCMMALAIPRSADAQHARDVGEVVGPERRRMARDKVAIRDVHHDGAVRLQPPETQRERLARHRNNGPAIDTTSGYSTMLLKSSGAASVSNSPPSIPPSDTQK